MNRRDLLILETEPVRIALRVVSACSALVFLVAGGVHIVAMPSYGEPKLLADFSEASPGQYVRVQEVVLDCDRFLKTPGLD